MKKIEELTDAEGREILKFVYPSEDNYYQKLSFEPHIEEDGSQQITMGGRSLVGIFYHNGQDNCILHFDNTKVVQWLYEHGYDIGKQLKMNAYMSEMESDWEEFGYLIWSYIVKCESEHLTVDDIKQKCDKWLKTYYYKDYE